MNIVTAKNLACPMDKLALIKSDRSYLCSHGHCFDIAKQGYLNLLPVQHKKSKEPGDSKAMVQARRDFFVGDFYKPIADRLSELVFKNLGDDKELCVFDAGCGEGYYLDHIINAAKKLDKGQSKDQNISFVGLDISKPAIIAACKKNQQASWLVGTNSQPPLLEQSIDLVFCVFGFHSFSGFKSILKPSAKVILVEPGKKHLQELKAIIYSEPAIEKSTKHSHDDFQLISTQNLEFKIELKSKQQILNLLTMTPHLFRANHDGKTSIETMDELSLTTDIIFNLFEFNPTS